MENKQILAALPRALLPWYYENKRALPWRTDREPYHIWVSEIMLQQTRVEAVKGYYARFLEALPDIEALARCPEDRLHKLWEGLGYYSRVRNLRKAAEVILEKHGGIFPRTHGEVLSLPGIGSYTAGAICSICYNQKTPAVDGNVLRLLSRLLDDGAPIDDPKTKRRAEEALAAVYPDAAGDFTQALMELGATVCGPNRKPDCENCPCKRFCLGRLRGTAESLPVKQPKKQRRVEDRTVLIVRYGDCYALEKRPGKGLLAGLWQFPNIAGALDAPRAVEAAQELGLRVRDIRRIVEKKHIFTHIQWNMTGIYMEAEECAPGFVWRQEQEIQAESALPTAFRQFWEERDYV